MTSAKTIFLLIVLLMLTPQSRAEGGSQWPPPPLMEWMLPLDPFGVVPQEQRALIAKAATAFSNETKVSAFIVCIPDAAFAKLAKTFFRELTDQTTNLNALILVASVDSNGMAILYSKNLDLLIGSVGVNNVARVQLDSRSNQAGTVHLRLAKVLKAVSDELARQRPASGLQKQQIPSLLPGGASGDSDNQTSFITSRPPSRIWPAAALLVLSLVVGFVVLLYLAAKAEKVPINWHRPSLKPLVNQWRAFVKRSRSEWAESERLRNVEDEDEEDDICPGEPTVVKRTSIPTKKELEATPAPTKMISPNTKKDNLPSPITNRRSG